MNFTFVSVYFDHLSPATPTPPLPTQSPKWSGKGHKWMLTGMHYNWVTLNLEIQIVSFASMPTQLFPRTSKQVWSSFQWEILSPLFKIICYTNILEKVWIKTVNVCAHKTCRNARDPWRNVSQHIYFSFLQSWPHESSICMPLYWLLWLIWLTRVGTKSICFIQHIIKATINRTRTNKMSQPELLISTLSTRVPVSIYWTNPINYRFQLTESDDYLFKFLYWHFHLELL